jgi:CDP-diacylglycerol--glycerol-3-phosphate 3-phosphatidyltransferase
VLQFAALLLMLWPGTWPWAAGLQSLGWWLFWPSLVLALWSAVGYARQA